MTLTFKLESFQKDGSAGMPSVADATPAQLVSLAGSQDGQPTRVFLSGLPASVVRELGLVPGDAFTVTVTGAR